MSSSVSLIESAKSLAAHRAVAEHFKPTYTHVGIGSGSTVKYVVQAIAETLSKVDLASQDPAHPALAQTIKFIPTGAQSKHMILSAGLTPTSLEDIPADIVLDVAFDGADEVDEEMNCVKGGGAALFQEKCVVLRARTFICVADFRKLSDQLLTNWPSIPIEVAPMAAPDVLRQLELLGSVKPAVRSSVAAPHHSNQDSAELEVIAPLKTDQGFYIIDAPFPKPLEISTVAELSSKIKSMIGVLEVGIFAGEDGIDAAERIKTEGKDDKGRVGGQKPVMAYFGMEDGSVQTRVRKGGVPGK